MSCLSYFYQTSFKQTERRFSGLKFDRGCLRITYGTLTVSSSYHYDILTMSAYDEVGLVWKTPDQPQVSQIQIPEAQLRLIVSRSTEVRNVNNPVQNPIELIRK